MHDSPQESLSPEMAHLLALKTFAEQAGLNASIRLYSPAEADIFEEPGFVVVLMPNGRDFRSISVSASRARAFMAAPIADLIFLGEYNAIFNKSTGDIEARITSAAVNAPQTLSGQHLWKLPGAEVEVDEDEDDEEFRVESSPSKWRLRLEDDQKAIELSPVTPVASLFFGVHGSAVTIKLSGFGATYHDDALEVLEGQSRTLFFDLDVMFSRTLRLVRRAQRTGLHIQDDVSHPPAFPRNSYSQEAVDLYHYGRSAGGLPLLEYLAYYQALEYFFPSFAHEEVTKALRTAIASPRFNPASDGDIAKLINTARPAVQAGLGEREQLRATLRAAVTTAALREFIQSMGDGGTQLTAKKQPIRGLLPLQTGQNDLREALADRIYTIRCRIVHTKQDSTTNGLEILLPTGPEASALGPEISLIRYVAQQAILARAQRVS